MGRMDLVKKVVFSLCALQVSSQVSLIRNFDPQDCIIEGTVITLTCTVEDRNNGFGGTIITGSQAIFDCPNDNSIEDNKLYLQHSHMKSAEAYCGNLISGQIVEVEPNETPSVTVFIAQINITTTIAMNGGYVECSELGMNDSQQIMLANINVLPTIYVEFPSDATFVIRWNQLSIDEGATQISHYSTSVTGEDCGECTNLGIVSNVTNHLSCTGWDPNGQVCNVTVTTVTPACGLQQLSSLRLVYLIVPEAPLLEDLMPSYSFNLEELQSMKILLIVEATVDPNDLPITFQVNVERSSQYEIPKCSLNISGNKCLSKNQIFRCEIDFNVSSSCPQLRLQPKQEADYQIVFFSENSIGRSLNAISNFTVPSYAHLKVQLSFENDQEEYSFISIGFSQVYDKVISMIEYGPNCLALGNQTKIVGFDVTTLTFSVPGGVMDDICYIVIINNTFQSLAIQGNFSFSNSCSCSQDANQESNVYLSAIGSLLISTGIILHINIITVYWCVRRKYKKAERDNMKNIIIFQSNMLPGNETDQEQT